MHPPQFPNVSTGKNFKIHLDRIRQEKYFTAILVWYLNEKFQSEIKFSLSTEKLLLQKNLA